MDILNNLFLRYHPNFNSSSVSVTDPQQYSTPVKDIDENDKKPDNKNENIKISPIPKYTVQNSSALIEPGLSSFLNAEKIGLSTIKNNKVQFAEPYVSYNVKNMVLSTFQSSSFSNTNDTFVETECNNKKKRFRPYLRNITSWVAAFDKNAVEFSLNSKTLLSTTTDLSLSAGGSVTKTPLCPLDSNVPDKTPPFLDDDIAELQPLAKDDENLTSIRKSEVLPAKNIIDSNCDHIGIPYVKENEEKSLPLANKKETMPILTLDTNVSDYSRDKNLSLKINYNNNKKILPAKASAANKSNPVVVINPLWNNSNNLTMKNNRKLRFSSAFKLSSPCILW